MCDNCYMDADKTVRGASALLHFRGSNLRSYRDELDFSMLATAMADKRVVHHVEWSDSGNTVSVLPAAGIYGANASGKTNALKVLADMRQLVLASFRTADPSGGVERHPFLLDPSFRQKPSMCEFDLVLNGTRHLYGFAFDDDHIIEEWAYHYPRGRSALLFRRDEDDVSLGAAHRRQGRAVVDLLRPNALFLSTAASANHPGLMPLYEWFQQNLAIADTSTRERRQLFTASMLDSTEHKERIISLLRSADLGVTGAATVTMDAATRARLERLLKFLNDDIPEANIDLEELPEAVSVVMKHEGAVGDVLFEMADESLGTRVWFGLVGPTIKALDEGSVLLVDELDASLHPMLVDQLVRLFQDPGRNPNCAQLIFNSHDIGLMGDSEARTLGRDQIWFTEKIQDGSTRMTSLADFSPRKSEAIGRRYLSGRFGATPILFPPDLGDLVGSAAEGGARQ